jgi:hypothetical protein
MSSDLHLCGLVKNYPTGERISADADMKQAVIS